MKGKALVFLSIILLFGCTLDNDITGIVYNYSSKNVRFVIVDSDGTSRMSYFIGSNAQSEIVGKKDSKYLLTDAGGTILTDVVAVSVVGQSSTISDGYKGYLVDVSVKDDNNPATVSWYRFLNTTGGKVSVNITSGDPVESTFDIYPFSLKTVYFTTINQFNYSYSVSGIADAISVESTNVGYLKAFVTKK